MQKYSVKILLKYNKKNELGQIPIYIRVTINRKTSFISTGHMVFEKQWDERNELVREGNIYHKQINDDLTNRKREILQELVNASIKGQDLSAKGVKDLQKGKLNNIFSFKDNLIKQVKGKRAKGTIENYKKHFKKLEEYHGSTNLAFEEINTDYLNNFEAWMRDNTNTREGSDPNNYIEAIMRTIRTMFNAAKTKRIISHYPFAGYEMPKSTPGNKAYLSLKEINSWHKYTFETEHPVYGQVALYFLFACYTGLRLSDWRDFTEGKIREHNISLKAIKNKVWAAVPLHDRLIKTIALMKKRPLTLTEININKNLKKIAAYLKINKSLSTHCGRKTFAVTMCLERGVSSETAAKLMGITLAVFEKNYSFVTSEKIHLETQKAWKDL